MRDALTALGVLIILILSAALIAPLFINWEGHRGAIAEQVSRAIGRPVEINGAIEVQLLPTPRFRLGDVTFGTADGRGKVSIGDATLSLALPSLLKGQVRITDAALRRPALWLPEPRAASDRAAGNVPVVPPLSVDRLVIREGAIIRAGETEPFISGIDADLEVGGLIGPVRGSARFIQESQPRTLRFALARYEQGQSRVKALIEDEALAARLELEGAFVASENGIGYQGAISGNGNLAFIKQERFAQMLWRVRAKAQPRPDGSRLEDVEITLGTDPRTVVFTGTADVQFSGARNLDAVLSTRQVDIDRLLAEDGKDDVQRPVRLVEAFADSFKGGDAAQLPVRLDISVGAIVMGGDTLSNARLVLDGAGETLRVERFEANLPGETQIQATPTVGGSTSLALETRNSARLLAWYRGGPGLTPPFKRFQLTSEVSLGGGEVLLRNATLALDRSRISGEFRFNRAAADGRGRLMARLTADPLDVEEIPVVERGEDGPDLDIDLAANRVRWREVGAGRIQARVIKSGDALSIPEIRVADFGGAELKASGTIAPDGTTFSVALDARQLDALSALVQRVLPGPAADALVARASVLTPARMTMNGRRVGQTDDITFDGTLGGTKVTGTAALDRDGSIAAGRELSATLTAPDSSALLRQFGIPAVSVAGAGPAMLNIRLGGPKPGSDRDLTLAGTVAGLALDARASLPSGQTVSGLRGRLAMDSNDLAAFAKIVQWRAPPIAPGTPVRVRADMRFDDFKLTLAGLDAHLGGEPIRGELAFNLLEFGRISGQLRLGTVYAAAFSPVVFGSDGPSPAVSDATRRTSPFMAPQAPPLPGDIWFEADRLVLANGTVIDRPKMVVRFERGFLYLEHADIGIGGGRAKGQLSLRRNGPQLALTSRATLDGVSLADLGMRPPFAARASGQLDMSSTGESPAGVVDALSGIGRLSLKDMSISGFDPAGLSRFLRSQRGDNIVFEPGSIAQRLASQLLTRNLHKAPPVEATVSITNGVLRGGPLNIGTGEVPVSLFVTADLRNRQIEARAVVTAREQPKDWVGGDPQAIVQWRGPFDQPTAGLDVASLANGLTAMALAREMDRLDIFDQDLRERQFFLRRQRASDDERRRLEEARRQEAAKAEEARREEIRRQEEARREDARKLEEARRIELTRRRQEEEARRQEQDRQRREQERALDLAPIRNPVPPLAPPVDIAPLVTPQPSR